MVRKSTQFWASWASRSVTLKLMFTTCTTSRYRSPPVTMLLYQAQVLRSAVPGLAVDAGAVEERRDHVLLGAEAAQHQADGVHRGQQEHGQGQQEAAVVGLCMLRPTYQMQWWSRRRTHEPHVRQCPALGGRIILHAGHVLHFPAAPSSFIVCEDAAIPEAAADRTGPRRLSPSSEAVSTNPGPLLVRTRHTTVRMTPEVTAHCCGRPTSPRVVPQHQDGQRRQDGDAQQEVQRGDPQQHGQQQQHRDGRDLQALHDGAADRRLASAWRGAVLQPPARGQSSAPPYLLKASSRSSQSQQPYWSTSHWQQHMWSSGSGGFSFSHFITAGDEEGRRGRREHELCGGVQTGRSAVHTRNMTDESER
ncbi:hypothetical protein EYF80_036450 [Liparis tanakae]|uniref:Uncharacterized protein n=1 Tax=Liparis tanakae TaxID=230148 RepID=A0A4Z2GJ72_9TELE|nr:hypothetical protein EYF80_036450 [Liparis tanakae]